jgi:hypothetical protein
MIAMSKQKRQVYEFDNFRLEVPAAALAITAGDLVNSREVPNPRKMAGGPIPQGIL